MNTEVFDNIGRVISDAADVVGRKTGELVETTRLKNQIYGLEREIKKDLVDLGRMIYERYVNEGTIETDLLPICEEIARKELLADEYKREIDDLKNETRN